MSTSVVKVMRVMEVMGWRSHPPPFQFAFATTFLLTFVTLMVSFVYGSYSAVRRISLVCPEEERHR